MFLFFMLAGDVFVEYRLVWQPRHTLAELRGEAAAAPLRTNT
jgi:hypothetical protein